MKITTTMLVYLLIVVVIGNLALGVMAVMALWQVWGLQFFLPWIGLTIVSWYVAWNINSYAWKNTK